MRPITAPLLPLAMLLAACSDSGAAPEASAEAARDARNAGNVASAMAGSATGLVDISDLPDFVEMYQGATPIMNMKTNDSGAAGGLLSYTTTAPITEVVAFHRASAKRNGIDFKTEAATPDGMTLAGTSADEARSLMVMIARGEAETTVSLTHARKTG
ncbi:hypothetical protein GCM10007973_26580 [Polymorphobacter multimanifer]|uniref:hypothetical protein n=1 Tax=Polymorphobacter multimanifer TaxID=1070431 RepID=UPI00166A2A19|nr:hypothetical protein [Polymorphobacter multimanifer]GGI88896.1 hypothetical protein GCM10007973_26580 [Polymorphobacter multimanifer]